MVSHYNAYYNGNDALKTAIKEISKANVDDYSDVLDVFPLGTPDIAVLSAPNLDRTITKASIVISKHSMFFKKKEYVKWVPASYILMGEARFYKQEYGTSKEIFKYIATKYPKEKVKQDAVVWIALIESIQGNYNNSKSSLDAVANKIVNGEASQNAYRMLPMVYADVYLRQKNYSAAIPQLKEAISRANRKPVRSRLYFILGQVEELSGNNKEAVNYFSQVLKNNPEYEMDFNARMNIAKCYEGGNSKTVVKQLNKMLKDSKNEDYQDQIYYVLAEVALKDKDKPKAIKYLELSVKQSKTNKTQKGLSSLKLAEIYFDDQKYIKSQAYYDSTMVFIPKDYFDYENLNNRKNILTELTKNLIIIQTEDSLQKIAKMPENTRAKFIDKLIDQEKQNEAQAAAEEQKRKESQELATSNQQLVNQIQPVNNKNANSWYFYNPSSVKQGYAEFIQHWGNRKLADDWRLSDKVKNEDFTSISASDETQSNTNNTTKQSVGKNKNITKKSREYYSQNLPLTQALIDSSNAKIEIALLNSAIIYKEKLLNNAKAKESFDELLKRFPKGKNTDQAYYNLYSIYNNESNSGDAKYYKNKLIKEYPESDYAKILADPNYFKTLQSKENSAKLFYSQTYQLYKNKNYAEVQANCIKAKSDYADNATELSKFEMLNALCVGAKKDTVAFVAALKNVVNNFPQSDVSTLAQQMIDKLQNKNTAVAENTNDKTTTQTSDISHYTENKDQPYLFVVIANKKNVKIEELKNNISDHNQKYFGTNNLTVSAVPINSDIVLLSSSDFSDENLAMEYYNSTKRNSLLYVLLKKNGGNYFIISQSNYAILFKTKDLEGYRKFAEKYYQE